MSTRKLLLWLAGLIGVATTLLFGVAAASAAPPAPKEAPQRANAINSNNWTNLYPDLYAVSAVSSSEAWAVGEYGHVVHYTVGAWVAVDPANMRGLALADVDMLADGTGWVVAGDHAFNYDGANWIESSAGLSSTFSLRRIGVGAPDSVWAVTEQGGLAHWDGASWMPVAPVVTDTHPFNLADVAMSGPDDGWAVGSVDIDNPTVLQYATGFILHYDGQNWREVDAVPLHPVRWEQVAVPDDGSDGLALSGADAGRSLVWNVVAYRRSDTWNSSALWDLPTNTYMTHVMMTSTPGVTLAPGSYIYNLVGSELTKEYGSRLTPHFFDIDGSGASAWAVGTADTIVARQADGSWVKQRGSDVGTNINDVKAISADEAWAAVDYDTILHFTAGQVVSYTLPVNYTEPAYQGYSLAAIDMISPTQGYAVGLNRIAHWDGVSWSAVITHDVALNAVALTGPDTGWAVGAGGSIWRLTGGVWSASDSPVNADLNAVVMDADTHGWAAGYYFSSVDEQFYPTLLEYSGGSWIDRSSALPAGAYKISDLALGSAPGEVYAAGTHYDERLYPQSGRILHLQDGVWSMTETAVPLNAVVREASGEAWAVGCNSALHFVAGAWQEEELPTEELPTMENPNYYNCLYSIDLIPGQGGWAVGANGKVLRYLPLAAGQRFYDVQPDNPFYGYINYVAAQGIVSGYADNTFHPFADVTRAQLTKIVTLAVGWDLVDPANPTFGDVPTTDTFYKYVETAAQHNAISGYADGSFKPYNNITRGQLSKVVVVAKGWQLANPTRPTFGDVSRDNTFYKYVETAVDHGIINGYGDGSFKPYNNATRGQIAKIVYLAVAPAQK